MLSSVLEKATKGYPFGADDFFQQLLGSLLLSSPFIFTEEVWEIASKISILQSGTMLLFTLAIGHGVLYIASQKREWDTERKLFGVTYRYISLIATSVGSLVLILGLTSAAQTFGASAQTTLNAISIVSIFAVIGAATADNLV